MNSYLNKERPLVYCPGCTHDKITKGLDKAFGQLNLPADKTGDFAYIIEEITKKTAEADMTGRLSTWPVPVSMMFVEAGAEYAKAWIEEGFNKLDDAQLDIAFGKYLADFGGGEVAVTHLNDATGDYPNFKMVLSSFLTF